MHKKTILVILGFFSIMSIILGNHIAQLQLHVKNYAASSTTLTFTLSFDGLGNSGDRTNPTNSELSTKNPSPGVKNITLYIFNMAQQLVSTQVGSVTYNHQSGFFTGDIDLGKSFSSGDYILAVKGDGYLRKRIPGTIHINAQSQVTVPGNVSLVAGDLNGDNALSILDYSILINCYSDILTPPKFCDKTRQRMSDYSGDGAVDMLDYNLFLREISVVQNGD